MERQTPGSWSAHADKLAGKAIADADPTRWFEDLYRAGIDGEVQMPWDRTEPNALLVEWAERQQIEGAGRRAVVVGSGLGEDAEYLARLGFTTTGFDIAESAIQVARERHIGSGVAYEVGNLFDLPESWVGAFDLVMEAYTVQALPDPPRSDAIAGVSSLVAPGGTLLVIAFRGEEEVHGPPWPVTRAQLDSFGRDGLELTSVEELSNTTGAPFDHYRAEFHHLA